MREAAWATGKCAGKSSKTTAAFSFDILFLEILVDFEAWDI